MMSVLSRPHMVHLYQIFAFVGYFVAIMLNYINPFTPTVINM